MESSLPGGLGALVPKWTNDGNWLARNWTCCAIAAGVHEDVRFHDVLHRRPAGVHGVEPNLLRERERKMPFGTCGLQVRHTGFMLKHCLTVRF